MIHDYDYFSPYPNNIEQKIIIKKMPSLLKSETKVKKNTEMSNEEFFL